MTRTFAWLVALLLCATGCGSSDGDAHPAEVEKLTSAKETAVVKRLEKFLDFGYEAAPRIPRCIATGLVKEVGIERLQSGGALNEDLRVRNRSWHLPKEDANTVADVWLMCENYKLFAARLVVGEYPDLNDPYTRGCIRDLTEADVREVIVIGASGTDTSDPTQLRMYRKFDRAGCGYEGDG